MKDSFIGQGWLVLVLALAFGGALAGVDVSLRDRIAQNKLDETLSRIPDLVDGASGGQKLEIGGREVFRAIDKNGTQVGWVLPASGAGFADRIELLIGLDLTARTITGMAVLSQKETPELGSKIDSDAAWRAQFAGEPAGELDLVKARQYNIAPDGKIVAISGATISSGSVTDIVNKALAQMTPKLAAAATTPAATAPDSLPAEDHD